jgi:Zn-dependent peptidase ImmA (M78 family)
LESNDYPVRSFDEVEELANGLIRDYCGHTQLDTLTPPIPVEDIAEHFLGYAIDVTNEGLFSDPEFLGGIDFQTKRIYVNASIVEHDGRYSFTVAHEIGHHILHRDHYLKLSTELEQEILCREESDKPQIELEADRFAAALLMPHDLILDTFHKLYLSKKVRSVGQARGVAANMIKTGSFSNVSNTSMLNRLIDLKLLPSTIRYQDGISRPFARRPRPLVVLKKKLASLFHRG